MTARIGNAEYLRELREKAAAEGKCYICRARSAKAGLRNCEVCLDKRRERDAAYLAVGLCDCGRDPRPGRHDCERCAAQAGVNAKARRRRAVAAGTCTRCHVAKAVTGRTQCQSCLDDLRDRKLASARAAGSKPKACPVCRSLGLSGTGHNRPTHDRWMERAKAWAPTEASP